MKNDNQLINEAYNSMKNGTDYLLVKYATTDHEILSYDFVNYMKGITEMVRGYKEYAITNSHNGAVMNLRRDDYGNDILELEEELWILTIGGTGFEGKDINGEAKYDFYGLAEAMSEDVMADAIDGYIEREILNR